jgi:hypothetical protein
MQIPAGKYFVGHFEILPHEFQEAWDSVCLWLSESGFHPTIRILMSYIIITMKNTPKKN